MKSPAWRTPHSFSCVLTASTSCFAMPCTCRSGRTVSGPKNPALPHGSRNWSRPIRRLVHRRSWQRAPPRSGHRHDRGRPRNSPAPARPKCPEGGAADASGGRQVALGQRSDDGAHLVFLLFRHRLSSRRQRPQDRVILPRAHAKVSALHTKGEAHGAVVADLALLHI